MRCGGSAALRPAVQTIDQNLAHALCHGSGFSACNGNCLEIGWSKQIIWGTQEESYLSGKRLNRYTGDRADGAVNRVNQSFGSIIHGFNAISSIYEGLAAQAMKRFSGGYTIQVAYTFSRSIDADWSLSAVAPVNSKVRWT